MRSGSQQTILKPKASVKDIDEVLDI